MSNIQMMPQDLSGLVNGKSDGDRSPENQDRVMNGLWHCMAMT